MRILLIHKFHYRLGGAEHIYFETGRLLEAAGHQVAYFSMQHPRNVASAWSKYFVEEVAYEGTTPNLWQKSVLSARILWNHEANTKLDQLITDFQPDVAHCFNIFHQLSPSIFHILRRRGIPTVMTLCDFKVLSPNYFLYHFNRQEIWDHTSGFRCIVDKAVKNSYLKSFVCAVEMWVHQALHSYLKVSAFLAPSQFLIDTFHRHGFTRDIQLVHHPIEAANQSAGDGMVVPQSNSPRIALFFGRLSREKGAHVLIGALRHTQNWQAWIVGYGPDDEYLRNLVQEYQLRDRVVFHGAKYGPELQALIAQVDVVVFPSVWYENQSFALMEGLQSPVPVVASRMGGIPDVVTDGRTGYLFAPGDGVDLARVLEQVGNESSIKKSEIVENAHNLVGEYTNERYLAEITAVYKKLSSK
jgi:glycosyltransferase involved in cell wall biosynthesis